GPRLPGLRDAARDALDAGRGPDRCPPVLLDDHVPTVIPDSVTLVTSGLPCSGAASVMASATPAPEPGGQSANTVGPAPATAAPYAPASLAAAMAVAVQG